MIFVAGPVWAPIQCPACEGEGELPFKTCHHGTKCPCDDGMGECPECHGRGTVMCSICGDHEAVSLDADGDQACANCLEAERDELAREAEFRKSLRVVG